MALKFNRNFNVGRVISRLLSGILSLYVGGTILTEFGNVMNGTASGLYDGLALIGWTTTDNMNGTGSTCSATATPAGNNIDNCITDVNGSGVLAVIGILVIAQVIMEFIRF